MIVAASLQRSSQTVKLLHLITLSSISVIALLHSNVPLCNTTLRSGSTGVQIEDRSLGMISRHIAASPFFAFSQVFHVGVANGRQPWGAFVALPLKTRRTSWLPQLTGITGPVYPSSPHAPNPHRLPLLERLSVMYVCDLFRAVPHSKVCVKSLTAILSGFVRQSCQTGPDPSGVRRESDTHSVVDGLIPTT